MKIAVINNETKYIQELTHILYKHEVLLMDWHAIDEATISQVDCIIISGSSLYSVRTKPDVYNQQETIISENTKPILGICAGFQLLAYTYGGTIIKSTKRITGIETMDILAKDDPLFANLPNQTVYEGHKLIVTKLPETLLGLAKSKYGYEVIRHATRLQYGVQFHPEVYPEETCGKQILENFLSIVQKHYENHTH